MAFSSYFLLLLITFVCIASSEAAIGNACNDQSVNQTTQVLANIDTLLSQLVRTTPKNGYSSASYGKSDEQVYGLAQCRADVSSKNCSTCIQTAVREVREACPNSTDARIWYDDCYLRYNTQDFRGQVDSSTENGIIFANRENVTHPRSFNKTLGALMDKIDSQAEVPKNKGLGKGESKVSPSVNLYALVQCTRDLSPRSCDQCLTAARGVFSGFCLKSKGCRVLFGSCFVQYEIYPFF